MNASLVLVVLIVTLLLSAGLHGQESRQPSIGETQIMKWKDGKQAVYLLAFDDSCPTHITNAIPELEKRNLVGTFYINPGNGPYKNLQAKWVEAAKSPAVVLGNHTFSHVGAFEVDQLDEELAKCSEVIHALNPNRKPPYLLSFARPGGVPWKLEAEQVNELLKKHHLVSRPPFQGPPFHHKTLEEGLKTIDVALEKGEMGHLDFHGVGGDWHVVPMDYYIPLLDRLQAESHRLWVTDHITYHKYVTQRKSTKVNVLSTSENEIRLMLTCDADPALYDLPLTLRTRVPAGWQRCTIHQGDEQIPSQPTDGFVQYSAKPGSEIVIVLHNQ